MLTRTLTIDDGNSETLVAIILQSPIQGDGFWECAFEIHWPEGTKWSRARGFDSVQATYLAMQNIAFHLYASHYHAEGKLRWGEPGTGYGFPMPKVGYEDLIGEDRIAQVPD
jgi:hypothetical protein